MQRRATTETSMQASMQPQKKLPGSARAPASLHPHPMPQFPTHRRVAKGLDQLVHRLPVGQPLKCVWLVLGCTRGAVGQQGQLLALASLSNCRACIELHRGRPDRNQAGLRAGRCINTLSGQALPAGGRHYNWCRRHRLGPTSPPIPPTKRVILRRGRGTGRPSIALVTKLRRITAAAEASNTCP